MATAAPTRVQQFGDATDKQKADAKRTAKRIGQNVKLVRQAHGKSRKDLAAWLAKAESSIKNNEMGGAPFSVEELKILSLKLRVPMKAFFAPINPEATAKRGRPSKKELEHKRHNGKS